MGGARWDVLAAVVGLGRSTPEEERAVWQVSMGPPAIWRIETGFVSSKRFKTTAAREEFRRRLCFSVYL